MRRKKKKREEKFKEYMWSNFYRNTFLFVKGKPVVPCKASHIPTQYYTQFNNIFTQYFTRRTQGEHITQYLHTDIHSSYIQITYTLHSTYTITSRHGGDW